MLRFLHSYFQANIYIAISVWYTDGYTRSWFWKERGVWWQEPVWSSKAGGYFSDFPASLPYTIKYKSRNAYERLGNDLTRRVGLFTTIILKAKHFLRRKL